MVDGFRKGKVKDPPLGDQGPGRSSSVRSKYSISSIRSKFSRKPKPQEKVQKPKVAPPVQQAVVQQQVAPKTTLSSLPETTNSSPEDSLLKEDDGDATKNGAASSSGSDSNMGTTVCDPPIVPCPQLPTFGDAAFGRNSYFYVESESTLEDQIQDMATLEDPTTQGDQTLPEDSKTQEGPETQEGPKTHEGSKTLDHKTLEIPKTLDGPSLESPMNGNAALNLEPTTPVSNRDAHPIMQSGYASEQGSSSNPSSVKKKYTPPVEPLPKLSTLASSLSQWLPMPSDSGDPFSLGSLDFSGPWDLASGVVATDATPSGLNVMPVDADKQVQEARRGSTPRQQATPSSSTDPVDPMEQLSSEKPVISITEMDKYLNNADQFIQESSPGEEVKILQGFIHQVLERRCPICDKRLMTADLDTIFEHASRIVSQTKDEGPQFLKLFSWQVACQHCKRMSCPACPSKHLEPTLPVFKAFAENAMPRWCCNAGRLFHIFALLCGTKRHPQDALASILQDHEVQSKLERASKRKQPKLSRALSKLSKVGAPSGSASGTGYATASEQSLSLPKPPKMPHAEDIEKSVEGLPSVLRALTTAWPSTAYESDFDQNPPQLLLVIARRSPVMSKIAALLIDDRIEEVARPKSVYTAIFDFLNVLDKHPFSAPLVRGTRPDYPLHKTLLSVCFGPVAGCTTSPSFEFDNVGKGKGKLKPEERQHPEEEDGLQPLSNFMSAWAVQARSVLKFNDVPVEDGGQTQAICRQIRDVVQHCEDRDALAASPFSPSCPDNLATNTGEIGPQEEGNAKLRKWLSEHKVAEIEGDDWLATYAHSGELRQTEKMAPVPGRMRKLVYEVSTLSTALPEGIFLRHSGERPDAMKVLMVGPVDTPYEKGLFEFDIFCPLDYPQSPPQVSFKSSPHNRRINPNLYINGMVCLSLLGTWDGPGWDPNTSTLLQLLVSLQAIVFCALPLWNEPGFSDKADKSVADLYNVGVRNDTLKCGMSEWLRQLEDGALRSGAWEEVVAKHFELNWRDIVGVLADWETKVPAAEVKKFPSNLLDYNFNIEHPRPVFQKRVRKLKDGFQKWADVTSAADKSLLK